MLLWLLAVLLAPPASGTTTTNLVNTSSTPINLTRYVHYLRYRPHNQSDEDGIGDYRPKPWSKKWAHMDNGKIYFSNRRNPECIVYSELRHIMQKRGLIVYDTLIIDIIVDAWETSDPSWFYHDRNSTTVKDIWVLMIMYQHKNYSNIPGLECKLTPLDDKPVIIEADMATMTIHIIRSHSPPCVGPLEPHSYDYLDILYADDKYNTLLPKNFSAKMSTRIINTTYTVHDIEPLEPLVRKSYPFRTYFWQN